MAARKRCRFGVVRGRPGGKCLKHPRRQKLTTRRRKRTGRKCQIRGILRLKDGSTRPGCVKFRGSKPSKRPLSRNWIAYGPMRRPPRHTPGLPGMRMGF